MFEELSIESDFSTPTEDESFHGLKLVSDVSTIWISSPPNEIWRWVPACFWTNEKRFEPFQSLYDSLNIGSCFLDQRNI